MESKGHRSYGVRIFVPGFNGHPGTGVPAFAVDTLVGDDAYIVPWAPIYFYWFRFPVCALIRSNDPENPSQKDRP